MKRVTIILLATVFMLGLMIGCQKLEYDDESMEITDKLLANNGGVRLFPRVKKADLANDIFILKKQFILDNGQIDSEENKREWFVKLRDMLEDIEHNDKWKYQVSDSRFLSAFKKIYGIRDTPYDLWGDHDFDGDPDWLDEDFQSSREKNKIDSLR